MARTYLNAFITDDETAKLLAAIEGADQGFRKYAQSLTPKQRRAILKPRTGGEKIAALIIKLAKKHGLQVAGVSLDELAEMMAAAQRLQELLTASQAFYQIIADTMHRWESDAWTGITLYYSLLNRVAKNNPRLRVGLTDANALFSRRSKAVQDERTVARADRESARAAKQATKKAKKAAATRQRVSDETGTTDQAVAPAEPALPANGKATAPNGSPVNGTAASGVTSNGVHAGE